jgi:hypothetical protein
MPTGNAAPNVDQSFAVAKKTVTGASLRTARFTTAQRRHNRDPHTQRRRGSDNVSLSGGTATFADKNVGIGKTVTATALTLSGTAAVNYQLASTSAMTTANITAKGVTVTGVTANNKIYDDTQPQRSIGQRSSAGVVSGDTVT